MAKITDEEFVAWIEGRLENNFNEYKIDGCGTIAKIMYLKNIKLNADILIGRMRDRLTPEEAKRLEEFESEFSSEE